MLCNFKMFVKTLKLSFHFSYSSLCKQQAFMKTNNNSTSSRCQVIHDKNKTVPVWWGFPLGEGVSSF